MNNDGRITIKDIAKRTHLSVATVSRILSNKGAHNSETVKKVREAASQMGYVRNTAAVDLVKKKSQVIAVIVSNTRSNFSVSIISAIEEKAVKNNLDVFILHAGNDDADSQARAIKTVVERAVMGIILVSLELDDEVLTIVKENHIPAICLSTSVKGGQLPFVTSDNFKMGYAATQLLINKGHQRIGLAGIPNYGSISERIKGYRQCMSDNQLSVKENWIQYGKCTYDDGVHAMVNYKQHLELTGVICASDFAAIGVMNTATEAGIKVPQDLSIVSFDGTEIVNMVRPTITSVTQAFYDMGTEGISFLIDHKENESKYLPFKIIERQSTRSLLQ